LIKFHGKLWNINLENYAKITLNRTGIVKVKKKNYLCNRLIEKVHFKTPLQNVKFSFGAGKLPNI